MECERLDLIADACGDIELLGTEANLVEALQRHNDAVDQLRAEVRDVCQPAAEALAVAWWHLEHAIRELTSKCSMGHALPIETGPACGCCNDYARLKSKARGRL